MDREGAEFFQQFCCYHPPSGGGLLDREGASAPRKKKLGPDFRRDDEEGKVRDDGKRKLGPDFRRDDEEGVAMTGECRLIIAVGQSIGG